MTETIINTYPEDGICYPIMSLNIRNIPCASTGTILDQYNLGESVINDQVIITNSYVWISWVSVSGRRVYMEIKDQATGE
ncbi:SH3 domain-containing protein, partial [Clostridium sp. HCS.1]|uniref:SH3 domain-containing protein n=1 Tax=Clostridium sp. HCS.1 TaxID=3238594 RepID=UPI003A0FF266